MSGIARIAAERERQIEEEGFSPQHDDEHRRSQLAMAAACYASPHRIYERFDGASDSVSFREAWPFETAWDKREDRHTGGLLGTNSLLRDPELRTRRLRELTKAGALIAAEIDRLERLGENAQ